MKKALFLILISLQLHSQKYINNNPNDTLSVDKLGKKIELESNLDSINKWNDYLLKIIKERKKIKNLNHKIKNYYQLSELNCFLTKSYLLNEKGKTKEAIKIYYKVLKLANPKKHKQIIGFVYGEIGTRHFVENDFTEAIKYYNHALNYLDKKKDAYYLSIIYNNIGLYFFKNNKPENALNYYKKSLELDLSLHNYSNIAIRCNNIHRVYLSLKNDVEALKYLELAKKYAIKANSDYDLCLIEKNFSFLYKNKNYKKYLNHLENSYKLAVKENRIDIIELSGLELYKIYKQEKQYLKALLVYEKVAFAKDSLYRKENQNELLKANFKYETEKKEQKIKVLAQEKQIAQLKTKQQKTIIFIIILIIFSTGIGLYFLFKKYQNNKEKQLLQINLEKLNAEKKVIESDLNTLKSQMNPHFIFNALNSIQSQFMFGNKLIANEMMSNFTKLTRTILEVSSENVIPLQTEIEILKRYLDLEKLRLKDDFNYAINIDKNLDIDYHKIPPMLIQPFAENSIKHGLLHKEGEKKLTIDFTLDQSEEFLVVTIEDNGIGRKKSEEIKSKNKHNSFSTNSIAQRLELLNENKKIKEMLVYEDLVNENGIGIGTRVILKIEF
ncbi:histidine kinase [Flavobacterium sp.]|jgi:two-component system LytT family sensor kinase|uniref:tetratricopeptide repeat-containing sensor histidine kinase n=1 Tax=Flavobacterium sp. TaxID=239 RepID=UPI0037C0BC0F